ncbi:MAG: HPr kinase/phosphorylase [Rhodobacterales bacterium]
MNRGGPAPDRQGQDPALNLHASCVAYAGAAVLIMGASGQGKSGLALQLMASGAGLVADDRTCLWAQNSPAGPELLADVPESLRGQIEARGLGILYAKSAGASPVRLIVDLDRQETERLPPFRTAVLLDIRLPLLHRVDSAAFPAAILQYLKAGRSA